MVKEYEIILVQLHSVQWCQVRAQIFSYTDLILKPKLCFLILRTMVWSWHYLKGICVLENGHQMLWNLVNRTPVLNYVYSVWNVWGRLKTSCNPPFFIRLTVQLFCNSLLTFMKQRESEPKLICIHICRKCLNAFQKRKIIWSLNKLNKKSHTVQYQLTILGDMWK
jgi:hypothetical protein